MRVTLDAGGTAQAIRDLMRVRKEAIERAAASTAGMLAKQGAEDVKAEMSRVFDRPIPWTINSVTHVEKSTKSKNLQALVPTDGSALVIFKETTSGSKNRGADIYLRAQVHGGPRRQKASEKRLQRLRLGGQQVYVVPTEYAERDGYGNVSRGQIVKILSALEALGGPGQGFNGNRRRDGRSRGRRRAEDYFVIWPGSNNARQIPGGRQLPNNLPPAIYRKFGEGAAAYIRPILIFAKKAPVYGVRLDPKAVVARTVATHAASFWLRSLARELKNP